MKSKNITTYIFTIIIMMFFPLCGVKAQKVILYGNKSWECPDFKANFEVLRKNRIMYNAYNDSIFLIHDHDQWVNFFRRRALKNHQIFLANKVALGNIYDYFKQDTIPYTAYRRLLEDFYDNYYSLSVSDPFVTLGICNILQDGFRVCPDSLNLSNVVNLWHGKTYEQIAALDNQRLNFKKAYEYYQADTLIQAGSKPNFFPSNLLAGLNMLNLNFLKHGIVTIAEHNALLKELKDAFRLYKDQINKSDPVLGSSLLRFFKKYDEDLLRNVYMSDSTVLPKNVADSLMNVIVNRNLSAKSLSSLSYLRTLLMQVKLEQISAKQATMLALERYQIDWKKIKKSRLSDNELNIYLQPIYTLFYLNDVSDMSYAKKRRIVKRICNDIEVAYQHRQDQQTTVSYIRSLNTLTTYPRVIKYLKPAERVHFLNTLNVATQVTTYAHSVHVSMIAEQLMKCVLLYEPELLIGCLGDKQVSEILRNKQKYLDFISNAGLYHDIGKNSIASVVNNDYRPLTDEEYAIIKKHPELGMQYLEIAPSLEKYKDTTLGHHKWYNGKGGYPDDFDNTKSPKRILIDIVTLSDCLQAATERIGRNYKGDKNFDTVMEEFRAGAGTRYNPDLVNLIDEHPDLAKKLADLIDDGWVEIYYDIYSQYFGK